jgi:hypothetical protein
MLTKLTRKLVALATGLHINTLRSSLRAYKAQTAAALRVVFVAEQARIQMEAAELEAQEQYAGARREELQAIARYELEASTLGAKL